MQEREIFLYPAAHNWRMSHNIASENHKLILIHGIKREVLPQIP